MHRLTRLSEHSPCWRTRGISIHLQCSSKAIQTHSLTTPSLVSLSYDLFGSCPLLLDASDIEFGIGGQQLLAELFFDSFTTRYRAEEREH